MGISVSSNMNHFYMLETFNSSSYSEIYHRWCDHQLPHCGIENQHDFLLSALWLSLFDFFSSSFTLFFPVSSDYHFTPFSYGINFFCLFSQTSKHIVFIFIRLAFQLKIVTSSSICVAVKDSISSFFWQNNVPIVYMHHILLINPLIDRYFGLFPILAIGNSAVINTRVQESL